jgi:hypothetical protein
VPAGLSAAVTSLPVTAVSRAIVASRPAGLRVRAGPTLRGVPHSTC